MSHVVVFLMLPVFMFGKEEKKKKCNIQLNGLMLKVMFHKSQMQRQYT